MRWSKLHDLMLVKKVLEAAPFQYKMNCKERGNCWAEIAKTLRNTSFPKFQVSKRSVRCRFAFLRQKYQNHRREHQPSLGIDGLIEYTLYEIMKRRHQEALLKFSQVNPIIVCQKCGGYKVSLGTQTL